MQHDRSRASLGDVVARALVLMLAQNVATRGISFLSQIVLAWLLAPGDFGVMGIALGITSIAEILIALGTDEVVVQRGPRSRHWFGVAFRMSLAMSLLVAGAVMALAPLAARLFAAPELTSLLRVMAAGLPFSAAAMMPATRLKSEMRFGELASYATLELVFIQSLTLLLAFLGFGALSFAIPIPLAAALRAGIFWWRAPLSLGLRVRRSYVGYLLRNGQLVLGTRLLVTMIGYGDALVLGLVAPPSVVGAYFLAVRIASQPVVLLAANITNVLFPALTQLVGEPERQRQTAFKALRILAYLILPFSFVQAAVARPLMTAALGSKWDASILPVQLLSIGLGFNALLWIAGTYMNVRREFRRVFVYAVVNAALFYVSVTAGAWADGARGTALAVCLLYVVIAPIECLLVFRSRQWSRDLGDLFVKPVILAGAAAAATAALVAVGPSGHWMIAWAGASAITGFALYGVLLRRSDRDSWDEIVRRVRCRREHASDPRA